MRFNPDLLRHCWFLAGPTASAMSLTISYTGSSSATVNIAYSGAFGMSDGYVYDLVSGSLPPGLTLISAGLIVGTPSVAGSYPFTVRLTDASGNTANFAFTIAVRSAITADGIGGGGAGRIRR